ncbi:hypothetical protein K0U83_07055 [bacterium]|nr:hypothetical protein [bacterium]
MIDELTFRDWAGCVVSDDPEIHALAGETPVEPQTLAGWITDMTEKLEWLLCGSK